MVMRIKQTFYGWEYMEIGNLYYYIILYIYMYDPTKLGVSENWVYPKKWHRNRQDD